jgi:hypothetical protein
VTVSPSGTVTFRYDYRFNGRRETLAIGRYGPGGISPAMARELLLEARAKPFSRCIACIGKAARETTDGLHQTFGVAMCRESSGISPWIRKACHMRWR